MREECYSVGNKLQHQVLVWWTWAEFLLEVGTYARKSRVKVKYFIRVHKIACRPSTNIFESMTRMVTGYICEI